MPIQTSILKISPPKTESFQIKILIFFSYFCSKHQGSSNKYTQYMFLSRNKKNNVYTCKPQFYHIKVGFKGSKLYRYVFVMHYCIYPKYTDRHAQVEWNRLESNHCLSSSLIRTTLFMIQTAHFSLIIR